MLLTWDFHQVTILKGEHVLIFWWNIGLVTSLRFFFWFVVNRGPENDPLNYPLSNNPEDMNIDLASAKSKQKLKKPSRDFSSYCKENMSREKASVMMTSS